MSFKPIQVLVAIIEQNGNVNITYLDESYYIERLNLIVDGVDYALQCVYDEGGYEGGGEYTERVFMLTDEDGTSKYVQVLGNYYSYSGTSWDPSNEWTEVEPYEVVVTKYKPV